MNVKDMISLGKMIDNLKTEEKQMFKLIENDNYIAPKTLPSIFNDSAFKKLLTPYYIKRQKIYVAVFNERPLPVFRFRDPAIAAAYKAFKKEYNIALRQLTSTARDLSLVVGGKTESPGLRALRANMKAYDKNQKRIKSENGRSNRSITRRF